MVVDMRQNRMEVLFVSVYSQRAENHRQKVREGLTEGKDLVVIAKVVG